MLNIISTGGQKGTPQTGKVKAESRHLVHTPVHYCSVQNCAVLHKAYIRHTLQVYMRAMNIVRFEKLVPTAYVHVY